MTSQQLEYVLILAEERSFSKAAQRLFVTQPSLSQFIKNLEAQLGIQLFDRSTSPIGLTIAGQAYVDAARKINNIETSLKNQLADITDLKTGILSLGTDAFRASSLLPKSLSVFKANHPGIHINMIEDNQQELEKNIVDGTLDLLIGTGDYDDRIYQAEVIAEERLYLAISEDNPLCAELEEYLLTADDIQDETDHFINTKPIPLSMLKDENFILLNKSQTYNTTCIDLCQSFGFIPNTILYTDHMETAFSWANNNLGVSFIPDTLVYYGNYKNHPKYFKIDHPLAIQKIMIVFKRNRYLTHASMEYIHTLKQLIGHGTWIALTREM